MYQKEKSYLELKVTFIHVFILIFSLILIGGFLFYLGYTAGKNSSPTHGSSLSVQNDDFGDNEILKFEPDKNSNVKKSNDIISSELDKYKIQKGKKIKVKKAKTIRKSTYYTIQVGSFNSHKLAKNYAEKFTDLGYQTDISQVNIDNRVWFRVRVGVFTTLSDAKHEKTKLEKLEKGKFSVVKSK